MTVIRKIVAKLVLVAIVLLAFLHYFGGATIKQAVNTGGPILLGVPVKLETAKLQPLSGHVYLGGLVVGNPEGFKTERLFELGHIEIILEPRSLLRDMIRITRIDINNPTITLERGLRSSNLGALLEQLEKKQAFKSGQPAPEKKPAEAGKKVVIDEIAINGAQLNLSITALGGAAAPLPLPPIKLRDLGKEKEGTSITDVLTALVRAIFTSVTEVLLNAGKLLGEGAELLGDGAQAIGVAAIDGASAVGGIAVDDATAIGGAVLDGASAALKGIGGLLGVEKKKEE